MEQCHAGTAGRGTRTVGRGSRCGKPQSGGGASGWRTLEVRHVGGANNSDPENPATGVSACDSALAGFAMAFIGMPS